MSRIIRVEPVEKLLQSHIRLLELAREFLEESGGCDHGVNICCCQLIADIEIATSVQADVLMLLRKTARQTAE